MSPTSVETGTRVPLGRLLVEAGLLTEAELEDALAEQQRSRRPLGEILVERGFVSGGAVANALASQHGGLLRTEYGVATGLKPRGAAAPATPALLPPALPGPPPRAETLDEHAAPLAARFGRAAEKTQASRPAPAPAPPDAADAAGPDERDERIAALETQVAALTVARDKALHAAALAIQTLDGLLADAEQRRQQAEARCAALETELERSRLPSSQRSTAPAAPDADPALSRHALHLPTPTGPELVARVGEVPAVGRELELVVGGQPTRFRVSRIEPAPLPGPHLDCAYLEPVSPSRARTAAAPRQRHLGASEPGCTNATRAAAASEGAGEAAPAPRPGGCGPRPHRRPHPCGLRRRSEKPTASATRASPSGSSSG